MSATSPSSPSTSASANSVPGVYSDLVGALIPVLSFDFQPSDLQTFKRLRASSFAFISFAEPPPFKSFSCNTYSPPRKCCKQKTYGLAKLFRCNIYKKHGGWAVRERFLHSNQAPILRYVLPSSVSGNPFVYHSYENTGVWMYSSHFGMRRYPVSLCPYLPSSLPRYLVTSQPSPSRQTTAARFPARWLLCGRSPYQ